MNACKCDALLYLLEDIVVYPHSGVEEDGRQEHVQKDVSRLHPQEQGEGISNPSQVQGEGQRLAKTT